MKINWNKVEQKLKTNEFSRPDAIIHELSHAYLCIGKRAFKDIGKQKDVVRLIREHFKVPENQDLWPDQFYPTEHIKLRKLLDRHEIRTAALSFIVLEMLGDSNLLLILSELKPAVSTFYRDKMETVFLQMCRLPETHKKAVKICQFLLSIS